MNVGGGSKPTSIPPCYDRFADIRVPGIDALLQDCVAKGQDIVDVIQTSGRGPVRVREGLNGFVPEIKEPEKDFHAHKTGFTPKPLPNTLRLAGFRTLVQRQGRHPEIRIIAFREMPTPAQPRLLALRLPDTDS